MKKYTAIYIDSWLQGSYTQSITNYRRLEQLENETVKEMLERNNILDNTALLFIGHPLLEGEDNV